MIPNMLSEVEKCKKKFPQAWKDAHTGNAHTEDFIRILASDLYLIDPKFGLNGKRGNPDDLSDDALNYLCTSDESTGRTPEGLPCVVIDVIGRAGAPDAYPTWQVFSQAPDANGAWVKPMPVLAPPAPTPVPPAPSFPYPDENTTVKAFQERVRKAYSDAGRAFPDPNDADAFRHFTRYGYSCHEMAEPQAADKHINELRKDLGL